MTPKDSLYFLVLLRTLHLSIFQDRLELNESEIILRPALLDIGFLILNLTSKIHHHQPDLGPAPLKGHW